MRLTSMWEDLSWRMSLYWGPGLGGSIMAYELREQLRAEDTITVVTKDPKYHFVPSNPWIAVGWRGPQGHLHRPGTR